MRFYREEARRLAIQPSPWPHLLRRSQLVAALAPWLLSYLYPSQRRWFERLHDNAWRQPVWFAAAAAASAPPRPPALSAHGQRRGEAHS